MMTNLAPLLEPGEEYRMHNGVPEIRTHAQAWRHWEKMGDYPVGKMGERCLGDPRYKNRRMLCHDDGSISLSYKGEHLITYHPDRSISVSGMAKQANADHHGRIFPVGVHWTIGTKTGPCVFTHPNDLEGNNNWWWLRRDKVTAPKCLVVRGHPDRPVRMHLVGNRWEPVDLAALVPFRWITFDRKTARGASDRQGIPDFISALDAYLAMGAELPDMEKSVTDAELLCRLRARDFVGVMAGLPRNPIYGNWTPGSARAIVGWVVRPSSLAKLRTQAIVEAGATILKEQGLLTLPEWLNVETQLKRFGAPK
jgi:hypothetical protein